MLGVYILTSLWISVICYYLIYKTNSLVKELLSQFAVISTALIDMLVFGVEITYDCNAIVWNCGECAGCDRHRMKKRFSNRFGIVVCGSMRYEDVLRGGLSCDFQT